MDDAEIDARHDEVVGEGQRIAPLAPDDLPPEAEELAAGMRTALDYKDPHPLHHYFATMARHPALFRCQMETGMQLLGNGAIPELERELAILRTAWIARAPYEWAEHVALAKRFGMAAEEIAAIRTGAGHPLWDEHRRAILSAVEQLLDRRAIDDATWAALSRRWDERQMIELPALVGQYHAVALVQNSLRVALNPGSLGLRAR